MSPSVSNHQRATLNMIHWAYATNLASHPQYSKFSHLLSPGWIPGHMVDNSDQQYASFRDNIPYLFVVIMLHPILRRLLDSFGYTKADNRFNQRISFDVGFALLFLLALHGFSALKVLLILYINYNIATRLKREYAPAITWIFNIGVLFPNELGRGYPFSSIANKVTPYTAPKDPTKATPKGNWGTAFDNYGGLIPRWEILFNVTVLRLISFNMDYYWSSYRAGDGTFEVRDYL